MPRMIPTSNTMETSQIPGPGTFEFSGVRPEQLGATEYTLITIVVDVTGSVYEFSDDLLETVKSIIKACQKNPRAENLMVRLISFNEDINEIHGFKPLSTIAIGDYDPFNPNGLTALYDATYSAVGATLAYGKRLVDQDFDVNAAVYIVTDGMDNMSTTTPKTIAKKIHEIRINEDLGSIITILVGVNTPTNGQQNGINQYLDAFKDQAQLTQYVGIGDATPRNLARLAKFVSASISSQSQALSSGNYSQPLMF